jgi:hypothetical protein
MKSSNDVSVVALVTSVVALTTYGIVIWRARVVAQRMEEDVSNIWVGDGKPMVKLLCFLYLLHATAANGVLISYFFVLVAECSRW